MKKADLSDYNSGEWTGNYVSVSLATNSYTSRFYSIEGSAQSIDSRTDGINVNNEGITTIEVSTSDGTNTVKKQYLIKIDKTAPNLLITSTTGVDSYPDTLKVEAQDNGIGVDYIELPDGTKINGNQSIDFISTYNSTKNGPISFKVADTIGNTATVNYTETNVINFETEWTISTDNTQITLRNLWKRRCICRLWGWNNRKYNRKLSNAYIYESRSIHSKSVRKM